MLTFKRYLESKNISSEFITGWDETAYGLKNWGVHPNKKTPQQWAAEMIEKITQMGKIDDRLKGSISALKKFLKDGHIEYLGTSLDSHDSDENRPSPFSSN